MEQQEASIVQDADEALLEMCKMMSATLQRLEHHVTARVQGSGIRATSITNAEEVTMKWMTKLENLTPEEIRGHEEPAIRWTTKLENPILEEHRGHEDMDPLSTIVNLSLNSHGSLRSLDPSVISDNVHAISPEIDGDHPPHLPLTVYYNCVSRDNLERIGKEYGCNEGEMIRPIKRDGIREVVDGLPQSNTCLDWKYYIPLYRDSVGGEQAGRGRGRPDFAWKWKWDGKNPGVGDWEQLNCHFVPYSHLEPPGETKPNPFTEEQQAKLSNHLGGLYTVPLDLRYRLFFQAWELRKKGWEDSIKAASEFSSFMKMLNEVGGSFTIRDYDDINPDTRLNEKRGRALYGCVKSRDGGSILTTTAQEAEEYFLDIPPISTENSMTRPWRRLIIFEGIANLNARSPELACFQRMGKDGGLLSMRMHLDTNRRTPADLDNLSSRNIFHINWFDLETLNQGRSMPGAAWKCGPLYGSMDRIIRAASFTIQAIPSGLPLATDDDPRRRPWRPRDQGAFDRINELDSRRWTIVLLTPIRYRKQPEINSPMVDTRDLKIGTLHVTLLSAIQIGLSSAVHAWIGIGDHMEAILGGEDIFLQPKKHDRFCFHDHTDFSQSKKCFWIINSVNNFHQSIQDTIYQWQWFYDNHIIYVEGERLRTDEDGEYRILTKLRDDIRDSYRALRAQSERFLSIQKQARELRDGLFGASSLINAKESVQEAKNSAQLGETVKLLTLVTIFFLPLGYITSLWAIITAPDLKTFAAVSVGTAMATYLVVLLVVKWEGICTTWLSEEEKPLTEGEENERPKSRLMNLKLKLRYRRGKKHDKKEV